MSRLYLRKGEEITCEQGHIVARATKDFFRDDVAESAGFEWIAIPKPETSRVKCFCGADFMMGGGPGVVLHVKDGWRAGALANWVLKLGKTVSPLPET